MRASTRTLASAAALLAAAALTAAPAAANPTAERPAPNDKVARGLYIVSTAGCHDCHTPWHMGPNGPEPDMSRALSGHPQDLAMPPAPKMGDGPWAVAIAATNTAYAGPWGVSYTANLTPDPDSGLGRWTVEDFKATIRTGRRAGRGREILPPMPIMVYNNMTDQDLEAIYAYLRTLPAVRNRVPEPRAPQAAN